ncbi:MAG: hypothetical protein R2911_40935 [Caldilineaceae bacterium]
MMPSWEWRWHRGLQVDVDGYLMAWVDRESQLTNDHLRQKLEWLTPNIGIPS